jgi:hypothetical protein
MNPCSAQSIQHTAQRAGVAVRPLHTLLPLSLLLLPCGA